MKIAAILKPLMNTMMDSMVEKFKDSIIEYLGENK
jgi:hypothetical protein